MNRNCNGHHFKVNRVNLYRCLFDGTVIKAGGQVCTSCGRRIDSTAKLGAVDFRSIKSTIEDPHGDLASVETVAHLIRHDDLFSGEWTQIHLQTPWKV